MGASIYPVVDFAKTKFTTGHTARLARARVCTKKIPILALIERFKLRGLAFSTEGGVEGTVQGEAIALANAGDMIGLFDEHQFRRNPVCRKILNWYGELLYIIFEDDLVIGNKNAGRGAILKLNPARLMLEEITRTILWH